MEAQCSEAQPEKQQDPVPNASQTVNGTEGGAAKRPVAPMHWTRPWGKKLPVFSKEEVATHRGQESCWLIAHGLVYDVTSFMARHPGGVKAILMHGGEDSTEDFEFHSRQAQKDWQPYIIGVLEPDKDQACLVS